MLHINVAHSGEVYQQECKASGEERVFYSHLYG